jgi:hypothetical protein
MDTDSMASLSPGTEGYAALLHEIGHALGLRHPRNIDLGDVWSQQLREVDDKTNWTVMSATSSSDGLFRADWGVLDIAALQYLYGARILNVGNTTYEVGGMDSRAQRSLIDDGGIDTVDASLAQRGVSIDLVPGHLSSIGVTGAGLSSTENLGIALGTLIENAVGSDYDDVMVGNALPNTLTGRAGNDWIDGGAGTDTAVFSGKRADYLVSSGFGNVFIAAGDGVSGFDTLRNIERVVFDDVSLALDVGATEASGQTALLLGAVLGQQALASKRPLVGAIIGLLDQGYTALQLSGAIMRLPIWDILTGQQKPTNTDVARYLLTTVNSSAPDVTTLNAAAKTLDMETGAAQGGFLWHLAESAANQAQVGLVGLAMTGLEYGGQ